MPFPPLYPSSTTAPAAAAPEPVPPPCVSVFRWVLTGTLAFHLVQFVLGIIALAGSTGSMNSIFRDAAVNEYQWDLVKSNLGVLLKGSLPLALGFAVLLFPLVRFSLKKSATPRRWSILWRTVLLSCAVHAWFSFRLAFTKPWLPGGVEGEHWYFALRRALPEDWRTPVFMALREIPPATVPLAVLLFYTVLLLQRWRPDWSKTTRLAAAFGLLTAVAGLNTAVAAWRHRSPDVAPLDGAASSFTAQADGDEAAPPRRPNILILASDSLRADHLSCNGYPRATSPAIDALAAESVNFTRCFTPIASTVESTTTMMSSQYPHTHGLQHMFPGKEKVEKVRRDIPALARLLGDQGYDTAVIGDWCAGVYNHLKLGFDEVNAPDYPDFKTFISQAVYLAHRMMPLYFDNEAGFRLFPQLEPGAMYVDPERVTDQVVDRLAAQNRTDRPFFLKVFYSCTHLPFAVAPEFTEKFTDPAYNGPHRHQVRFDVDEWISSTDSAEKWRTMTVGDARQINDLYDAGVRQFDAGVQRILEALRAGGQLENTIILITADHGDDLFDPWCTLGHGMSFNGGDQNSNVPCILRVPGLEKQAGRKVDKVVRTLDFAPTLLDLAGLAPDPRMEGVSLRPYLEQPGADLKLAFYGETAYPFYNRMIPGEQPLCLNLPMDRTVRIDRDFDFQFVMKQECENLLLQTKERVLRTTRWKLVFTPGVRYDIIRLYDLTADPHCESDVKLQYPEVFSLMKKHLWRWMQEQRESRIDEIFPSGEPAGQTPA